MSTVDPGNGDLVLEFRGTKASGLAMDPAGYKIERVDVTPAQTLVGELKTGIVDSSIKTWQYTISQEELNDFADHSTRPKYKFTVKDLFGLENSAQYTIIVDALPTLKSITSTSPSQCKMGDSIVINVNFSDTVTLDNFLNVEDLSTVEKSKLPYLKISGITNSSNADKDKAYYSGGSGSTSLQFTYVVQEGDESTTGISVPSSNPIVKQGATTLVDTKVHFTTVPSGENLQDYKTITIDGKSPKIENISINSIDKTEENKDSNNVYWLKEGRTLSVTVTTDEEITVQGNPTFILKAGNKTLSIPFTSSSGSTITFSKKITKDDANGAVTCTSTNDNPCVRSYSVIKDSYGNKLLLSSMHSKASSISGKYSIDTTAPAKPIIYSGTTADTVLTGGKKKNSVQFNIPETSDITVRTLQYSEDGGSNWEPRDITTLSNCKKTVSKTLTKSAQLTARLIDFAGNVSEYPDVIDLDINNSFPDFTIECTSSNGYYKAGDKLNFKVAFADKVKINNTNAKIYFESGNGAYASLKSAVNTTTGITLAEFEYTVKKEDQFKLKVSKTVSKTSGSEAGVVLDGFEDFYGFTQEESTGVYKSFGTEDYEREITCDGVIPYITEMAPGDEHGTGSNIYETGNVITITFNEPVQKGSGNITLRQVRGWAIPSVIESTDFNTICAKLDATDKNILSMQENGADMEDAEITVGNNPGNPNDAYHGTGQFVGPYKKSMQGLVKEGTAYVPDTSVKYVLAFDLDVWETDETKTINFGKTFTPGETSNRNQNKSNGRISVDSIKTPADSRSTQQLREIFEKAGYHERVVDVTSSIVSTDDNQTFTITFPKGLVGGAALPDGREWELVIEKGAFEDYAGHKFGAEYSTDTSITFDVTKKDGIMKKGKTKIDDNLDEWAITREGRGRASVTSGNGVVLIQTKNGQNSFWSDKVAEPVIRVDRYSYGYGIKQPKENTKEDGSKEIVLEPILRDSVIPSGRVRVRIDCATKGADIYYHDDKTRTGNSAGSTNLMYTSDNGGMQSFATTAANATALGTITRTGNNKDSKYTEIFLAGTDGYSASCKEYITAQGSKTGFSDSEKSMEGVFKTIVQFIHPQTAGGKATAERGNGERDYYIRGTTGLAGEPYIAPFPLRDSGVGSPYLRLTFRERSQNDKTTSTDYYWISFEILVPSSYSAYQYGLNNQNVYLYDWARHWGLMTYGCFNKCTNMTAWCND